MTENEMPTFFGDVSKSPTDFRVIGNSQVMSTMTFSNNLTVPITIVRRSGFKFVLRPEYSTDSRKLVVKVDTIIDSAVKIDAQRLLSAVGDDTQSAELKAMRDAFVQHSKINSYPGARLVLDYSLSLDDLRIHGGTVYHNELDCVISMLPFESAPPHPASESAKQIRMVKASKVHQDPNSFGYSVELVDNAGKYGDRFLNIGNHVYRVSPRQDLARKDGVYIVSNNPVTGKFDLTDVCLVYHTFEEAEEKVGLYKSCEEAFNLGDISLARKLELGAMEQSLAVMKNEAQMTKQRHEMEMLEKNRELKNLEMQRERHAQALTEAKERADIAAALERQRIKDFYEDRAYQRKDQSEMLKFIPGIVVAVGSMMMAIKAFKPAEVKESKK